MSLAPLPINSTVGSLNHGCWKRKGSDNEDESCDLRSKKAKYSWYVTLESESPQQSEDDEENESIYSLQERETDYVRDTSDTSTHTWVSSGDNGDMSVHVEYEVASLSEKENPFPDDSSSSDPEDIVTMGVIAAICDSDLGWADDSEDSRSSVDSEIGKADYWTCIRCNTRNNNPLFRYCEKCYQIRKNFFPPRPKWKRRRRRANKSLGSNKIRDLQESATDSGFFSSQGSKLSFTLDFNTEQTASSSQTSTPTSSSSTFSKDSADVTDCGFPSTSNPPSNNHAEELTSTANVNNEIQNSDICLSKDTIDLKHSSGIIECNEKLEKSVIRETIEERLESGKILQEANNSENVALDMKKDKDVLKAETGMDPTNAMCLTCTVNPKNGAFLHGSVLHICCCYRCAVKIWRNSGSCPICNRKVTNVLKAFYV